MSATNEQNVFMRMTIAFVHMGESDSYSRKEGPPGKSYTTEGGKLSIENRHEQSLKSYKTQPKSPKGECGFVAPVSRALNSRPLINFKG